MALNNYQKIYKYLPQNNDGSFLLLQIVRRQKDNREEKINESSIYTKLIYNQDQLLELMPMIIAICESMKARAYINLTKKYNDHLIKDLAKHFVDCVVDGNPRYPVREFNKIVGKQEGKRDVRYWMLDVDEDGEHAITPPMYDKIIEWVKNENVYVDEIQSPHGMHVIVRPFNLKKWKSENMPNIDIHKNSMGTILYFPSSIY